MSNLPAFGAYAAAFEDALQDDDWTRLERYFAADSAYRPGDGSEAIGRDAVIRALQDSVAALERKCDSRVLGKPEISESGDLITLKFSVTYTKEGLPDLILSGCETIQFSDGSIWKMEDVFDDPSAFLKWRDRL